MAAADSAEDRERELAAMVAVAPAYLAIEVRDAAGQRMTLESAPPFARFGSTLDDDLAELGRRGAQANPGQVVTSSPVADDPEGWVRIFVTSVPGLEDGTGSVALVVDTRSFFSNLEIL